MRLIRIGTRGSALARWQSDHVAARLAEVAPGLRTVIVEIASTGDQLTDEPLGLVEGTGFFTATIERALLEGHVDVAVHSYKDLPVESQGDLVVAAVPPRAPVEDALCGRDGLTLDLLPAGARVGTCSARRTAQILGLRSDLACVALRGNVPTRLERVARGDLDAVVLARAGLVRLRLEHHITEIFPVERVLPAPAQGALAVQCRREDTWLSEVVASLDDPSARRTVDAERTLLHALGGGCSVPVGAVARDAGPELALAAGVFGPRPGACVRVELRGDDPRRLGESAARRLLMLGAGDILAAFDRAARLDRTMIAGEQQ